MCETEKEHRAIYTNCTAFLTWSSCEHVHQNQIPTKQPEEVFQDYFNLLPQCAGFFISKGACVDKRHL